MIKQMAGATAALIIPKCRFDQMVFILGHMRCGSTALSHILCSHPKISGYGEAHVSYDNKSSLGVLALNQMRRKSYRASASLLFDKILHSHYDSNVDSGFFNARAIFMLREPVDTIRSIRQLFTRLESTEYSTDTLAADYYEQRLHTLLLNWELFPPERRIGLSYTQLTTDTDAKIASISRMLELTPGLSNNYTRPKHAMGHGAGDPLASHKYDRIVTSTRATNTADTNSSFELSGARLTELRNLYERALKIVTQV
ncbi:sulfotransferase [Nostoc sp. CHAB 5834]|nr:sulfotransferase [Nostoc sp. CHAB 5834]